MAKTEPEMRTYLIEHDNGKRRKVTVPATWKVTFGPAVVGANKAVNGYHKMPMALRFYENDDHQRAIFTDVSNFRDMSIEIEEEKVSVQEKTGILDVDGAQKHVVMNAEVRSWVNPDKEPDDKALKLAEKFNIDKLDNMTL